MGRRKLRWIAIELLQKSAVPESWWKSLTIEEIIRSIAECTKVLFGELGSALLIPTLRGCNRSPISVTTQKKKGYSTCCLIYAIRKAYNGIPM
ncbi:hypothetical protein IE077_000164 [Cardiosporidium cionae]|uniref:Uncharacterized protein n=1 Tax=Cardiosporidium cionae TaxID=476202 RepID=A0ABQ7J5A0_9APIC|nr:hypothetical protein IE077_000164 [Cardiosporidium cionae]|eukprot:KAF8819191.1 hypothetical protein IE077_000164 [Cardiosporidium cionae]